VVEVGLIGRLSFQAGVGTGVVVELDVLSEESSCVVDRVVGPEVDLSYLIVRQIRSTKNIVAPAALPSMLMAMLFFLSCWVKPRW